MHTLCFNILRAQYVEALFQQARVQQNVNQHGAQSNLHAYLFRDIPAFGNFSDAQGYARFVPGVHYLSDMLNKAIELEQADADQHTACLAPDQLAIDDSHKVGIILDITNRMTLTYIF